jgi:4-hydroxymandelate oxidase
VARAARKTGQQMILSTVGDSTVEECAKEDGSPIWYMIYPTDDWNVTQALVKYRASVSLGPSGVWPGRRGAT